jgi:hypothetical protein
MDADAIALISERLHDLFHKICATPSGFVNNHPRCL